MPRLTANAEDSRLGKRRRDDDLPPVPRQDAILTLIIGVGDVSEVSLINFGFSRSLILQGHAISMRFCDTPKAAVGVSWQPEWLLCACQAEAAVSSERERAVDYTQRRLAKALDRWSDLVRMCCSFSS